MKSVKTIIFFVGLFLINYVGGIPQDTRNLFISHAVFFAPYLTDFFPLLKIKSFLKWIIYPIWIAGIIVLALNIIGIAGVLKIESSHVVVMQGYYSLIKIDIPLNTYLFWSCVVYLTVFMASILFNYVLEYDKKLSKRKTKKPRKEMVENVSA